MSEQVKKIFGHPAALLGVSLTLILAIISFAYASGVQAQKIETIIVKNSPTRQEYADTISALTTQINTLNGNITILNGYLINLNKK